MRLKEIKPGMVIHCKNIAEYKRLEAETIKNGYGKLPLHNKSEDFIKKVVFYINDKNTLWGGLKKNCIEFSDLILPELTAEEALQIASEICKNTSHCAGCPIHGNCYRDCDSDKGNVVEVLCKWKSDHEKKEPEIETVDICRIIEIQPDGRKRCVHEIDLNPDGEMLFKEQIEEILKRYCMEHDGEFIAVHDVVCRVKAVE